MKHYTGMVLPKEWRASLDRGEAIPEGPLHANWTTGPDCVVGEVRIKEGRDGRVLHVALMDDGWEADDAKLDGPDTVELTLGGDSYIIFILWEDDPDLVSYFARLGASPPSAQPAC